MYDKNPFREVILNEQTALSKEMEDHAHKVIHAVLPDIEDAVKHGEYLHSSTRHTVADHMYDHFRNHPKFKDHHLKELDRIAKKVTSQYVDNDTALSRRKEKQEDARRERERNPKPRKERAKKEVVPKVKARQGISSYGRAPGTKLPVNSPYAWKRGNNQYGVAELKEGRQPRGYHNWNRAAETAKRLRAEKEGSTPNATVKKKQYSWGKMVVVHDGANDSFPLHPEHQHLLKQLRHNDSDTFTDETGRRVTAMRHGDHIHLSGPGSNKKLSFHRDELNEDFLLEKEQDAKMKAAGYKLVGRTSTKDPRKEKTNVTYSVYGKGARRKIIRTKGNKQVHEERGNYVR